MFHTNVQRLPKVTVGKKLSGGSESFHLLLQDAPVWCSAAVFLEFNRAESG